MRDVEYFVSVCTHVHALGVYIYLVKKKFNQFLEKPRRYTLKGKVANLPNVSDFMI